MDLIEKQKNKKRFPQLSAKLPPKSFCFHIIYMKLSSAPFVSKKRKKKA